MRDGVRFSGEDTWAFAEEQAEEHAEHAKEEALRGSGGGTSGSGRTAVVGGSLRHAVSDGHVHVRSDECAPVHRAVRRQLAGALGLLSS